MRRAARIAICLLALTACKREARNLRPAPTRLIIYGSSARESDLHPGGVQAYGVSNPDYGNAVSISEGERLFAWYNCSGCHSHGGGGIGPPLIKSEWIYGGEPANIFDTIVKGRPNGMPTWGGRIPEYQIWQLVAYVRSLNNQEPKAATPARTDMIAGDPGTIVNKTNGQTK